MENEQVTEEVLIEQQPGVWNTVTPLSKYLAMILFITLPFIGGWVGYTFAPEKIVEVEKVVEVGNNSGDNQKANDMSLESTDSNQENDSETKMFSVEDLDITFSYPDGWTYEKVSTDKPTEYTLYKFSNDGVAASLTMYPMRVAAGSMGARTEVIKTKELPQLGLVEFEETTLKGTGEILSQSISWGDVSSSENSSLPEGTIVINKADLSGPSLNTNEAALTLIDTVYETLSYNN